MEKTRAQAIARLNELNKITFPSSTARDLRGTRPMLQRVERRSQGRYNEQVESQKKRLKEEIKRIDNHLISITMRNEYVARRLAHERRVAEQRRAYEMSVIEYNLQQSTPIAPLQSTTIVSLQSTPIAPLPQVPQVSLFTETAPQVLPKPIVAIPNVPQRIRTRLQRYRRR